MNANQHLALSLLLMFGALVAVRELVNRDLLTALWAEHPVQIKGPNVTFDVNPHWPS